MFALQVNPRNKGIKIERKRRVRFLGSTLPMLFRLYKNITKRNLYVGVVKYNGKGERKATLLSPAAHLLSNFLPWREYIYL